jgi:hypothetical protein
MLAGFGLFLIFSYAVSWHCACLGILSKGPESAQGLGIIVCSSRVRLERDGADAAH